MFKSTLALLAAAFISTSAMATSINTGDTTTSNANASASAVGHGGNATGGNAYAGNYNEIYNKATAQQAQLQGQAQSQKQANQQNMTYNESSDVHYSGSYEVKNVPTAIAPTVYPTSPCMGSTSAGASGVGFGVSFGSSWTDDECGIRETARSFAGMQLKEDALAILCSSKYAAVAPACKKAE